MTLELDLYRFKIRFERLFADPRIFDQPPTFVKQYLRLMGVSKEALEEIYETSDFAPLDDAGHPCLPGGIGKFSYEGRMLRSEYMQGANLRVEYADFGSGLHPEDHRQLWKTGRWNELVIETRDFQHQHFETGIADIGQLYEMLRTRATPTTMATVELPVTTGAAFSATVRFLEDHLKRLSGTDGGTVEVYAARNLSQSENRSLEKRLGRASTDSTVYIILSADSDTLPKKQLGEKLQDSLV